MKTRLIIIFILSLIINKGMAQHRPLHTLGFENAAELHDFFRHDQSDRPIISGHRGGIISGYPENSIEAFEKTLQYTPAFFEIDPRMTKDQVVILMHDETLDRTTNGTGKVSDHTLSEIKQFRLKDSNGTLTHASIPTLEEAIVWAKGKTILNLDHKGVPFKVIADLVKKHQANAWVMYTVHSTEQAQYYLSQDSLAMFSAHIKTPEMIQEYQSANIPWNQLIAYIGAENRSENQIMLTLLHQKNVKVMVSTASSYDKLPTHKNRANAYREFISQGADILESDFPIEVAEALKK